MNNSVKVYIKAILQCLLALSGYWCSAQHTDSVRIDSMLVLSAEATRVGGSPVNVSPKHFYDMLNPFKEGIRPIILYNTADRFFVGVTYNHFSKQWKPDSAGVRSSIYVHYSIDQKAFSVGYQGIVHHFAGKWDLLFNAGYDWEKWINFYGAGNET